MEPIKGQYRQGDVLLTPAAGKPDGELKDDGHILAHGEATGHLHLLRGPQIAYFRDGSGGGRALIGNGGAEVVHQEHTAIPVEADCVKRVVRQVQYTPAAIQRVAD